MLQAAQPPTRLSAIGYAVRRPRPLGIVGWDGVVRQTVQDAGRHGVRSKMARRRAQSVVSRPQRADSQRHAPKGQPEGSHAAGELSGRQGLGIALPVPAPALHAACPDPPRPLVWHLVDAELQQSARGVRLGQPQPNPQPELVARPAVPHIELVQCRRAVLVQSLEPGLGCPHCEEGRVPVFVLHLVLVLLLCAVLTELAVALAASVALAIPGTDVQATWAMSPSQLAARGIVARDRSQLSARLLSLLLLLLLLPAMPTMTHGLGLPKLPLVAARTWLGSRCLGVPHPRATCPAAILRDTLLKGQTERLHELGGKGRLMDLMEHQLPRLAIE
mmetsp:Transcript_16004/g.51063  ORF Transcript_16004/g.51063 Transcript_16004/m.51063 type:complete len:332 (-) Transcript_16004:373-1368(-)